MNHRTHGTRACRPLHLVLATALAAATAGAAAQQPQGADDRQPMPENGVRTVVQQYEGTSYVTQGDANNAADLSPVQPEQVKGAVWYSVPELGWISVWMAGGWLGVVTDVVAVGLLLYGGWFVAAGLLERRRRPEEVVA